MKEGGERKRQSTAKRPREREETEKRRDIATPRNVLLPTTKKLEVFMILFHIVYHDKKIDLNKEKNKCKHNNTNTLFQTFYISSIFPSISLSKITQRKILEWKKILETEKIFSWSGENGGRGRRRERDRT